MQQNTIFLFRTISPYIARCRRRCTWHGLPFFTVFHLLRWRMAAKAFVPVTAMTPEHLTFVCVRNLIQSLENTFIYFYNCVVTLRFYNTIQCRRRQRRQRRLFTLSFFFIPLPFSGCCCTLFVCMFPTFCLVRVPRTLNGSKYSFRVVKAASRF